MQWVKGIAIGLFCLTGSTLVWPVFNHDPAHEALLELSIPPIIECHILSEDWLVIPKKQQADYKLPGAVRFTVSANTPWQVRLTPRHIPEDSSLAEMFLEGTRNTQSEMRQFDIHYQGFTNSAQNPIELVLTGTSQVKRKHLEKMQKLLKTEDARKLKTLF